MRRGEGNLLNALPPYWRLKELCQGRKKRKMLILCDAVDCKVMLDEGPRNVALYIGKERKLVKISLLISLDPRKSL